MRLPLPPDLLEETVYQAPEEIDRARKRGVERLGPIFEQGDYIAVIAVQQITIQLQSGLLEKLRNASVNDEGIDFMAIIDLADGARDATVSALNDLRQRLLRGGGNAEMPTIIRTPEQPPASRQPSIAPPVPARDTRRPPQDYLDPQEVTMRYESDVNANEPHQAGARRTGSLFGVFKRNPTRAASDGNVPRPGTLQPQGSPAPPPYHSRPNSDAEGVVSPIGDYNEGSRFTFRAANDYHDDFRAPDPSGHSFYGMDDRSMYSQRSRTNSIISTPASTAPTVSTRAGSVATKGMILSTPTPQNNFLGFCKGAWRVQNDDPKAMTEARDFAQTAQSKMTFPSCTKCAFRGHQDTKSIWNKVNVDEARGLKWRWSFLAKSHVKQKTVRDRHYAYQCLFCVFMGQKEPIIYTQNTYLDHVSKDHRKEMLDEVVLYRTRCINDRVCENSEQFDINLFPARRRQPSEKAPSVYEHLATDMRAFELAA